MSEDQKENELIEFANQSDQWVRDVIKDVKENGLPSEQRGIPFPHVPVYGRGDDDDDWVLYE